MTPYRRGILCDWRFCRARNSDKYEDLRRPLRLDDDRRTCLPKKRSAKPAEVAHIEQIVAAGGKLWKPATDVPGMLRFAVMSDPQGAAIVVFTPNPAMASPERPKPPTPGTIGWHELYTTDLEAGFNFYNKLFGWTKVSDMDMGPMGVYRIFDQGDHKQMGDGGMMRKAPQIPVSCWNFYFNVDSIRGAIQRVESGGCKVINGPIQVPGGAWIIQGHDPQGGKGGNEFNSCQSVLLALYRAGRGSRIPGQAS